MQGGFPVCGSALTSVGSPVRVSSTSGTTVGLITDCRWKVIRQGVNLGLSPDFKYAVPVFSLSVSGVPDAQQYEVFIGAGSWSFSAQELTGCGWVVDLS